MGILNQDLEEFTSSDLPFDKYRNRSFVVTGATGLIGSLLVKSLLECSAKYRLNLHVIAVVRDMKKAEEKFERNRELSFCCCDLREGTIDTDLPVDYILHTAAVTTSKDMVAYPADNMETSLLGTLAVLRLAVKKQVKGMVYLSSMEMYGQLEKNTDCVREEQLGWVDLTSARSCYPEGKRACEVLCNSYAHQYGLRIMCARLAQTFGPGVNRNENRVFAQFARSAMRGEDIVLHTKGLSEGNYVYTMDAVRGILLILTEGISAQAYNVCNENCHTTIYHMAETVALEIAAGKIRVVIDIPDDADKLGYAPDTKLHLSSEKLRTLGWKPTYDLTECYRRLITYMQEEQMI